MAEMFGFGSVEEAPRMGGGELVDRMRDNGVRLPVLIMSGHLRDPAEYDDPQVRFLAKPWTVEELARAVRGTLGE